MSLERSEQIDRLLHDAEHADSGAMVAGTMRDEEARRRLTYKRDDLISQAHMLDPHHVEQAWRETHLLVPEPNGVTALTPRAAGGTDAC